jgi:pimeloyl-ACP methyl ester carboxylesterase
MGLFYLVHGSTQNSSGWDLLVLELERRGHEVVRMNLPGNEPDSRGTRYAGLIVRTIPAERSDAVVVAHSASGLFLPLVAAQRRVRRIVFLAAIIPQIGRSFLDQMHENRDMLNPQWVGQDPTKDHQAARNFLFHDCSPEVTSWALTTLRLMLARQAMLEICPLGSWPHVPSTYLCRDDRTVRRIGAVVPRANNSASPPLSCPGGHCPHVSRPAQLADVLSALSQPRPLEL